MGLFLLDYGAGNVQSLANSLTALGHSFEWIKDAKDFDRATALIFPGVGAFETAIAHLRARGLFEPLRAFILSGRPYFGICIGMQVLFQSSAEAPSDVLGLGIVPCPIAAFDSSSKAVPHMGWNTASTQQGSAVYYFVHTYRAKYDPEVYPEAAEWVYTTTTYGDEIFVSSIRKGSVFASQFHPEKSGKAGLALIDAWLRNPGTAPALPQSSTPATLTKRIVACMDVRANDQGDLVVTKGDQYDVREKSDNNVRNLGKPVALAAKYYEAGADELCLLNITSFRHSPLQDQPMLALVRAAAECVFVPLTIGGGIKDSVDPDGTKRPALEVAGAYFRAGADKVSIGSEAVFAVERLLSLGGKQGDGTSAIETIAHIYGRQAVVVSIDPRRVYVDPSTYDGPYTSELVRHPQDPTKAWWYQCTVSGGREARPLSVVELSKGVEILGAGEILVNSIDRDGTGLGFDLDLVRLIKRSVRIPVVASSGAGSVQHFVDVFEQTPVEAALAAGIFHREEVPISDVKKGLKHAGISVREA